MATSIAPSPRAPFTTLDTLHYNFKSGEHCSSRDLRRRCLARCAADHDPVSAEEALTRLGTNSLDLAQLRIVFLAAKEAAKSAQIFSVQIAAADTASFDVLVQLCDLCKELGIETVSVRTLIGRICRK